MRIRIRAGQKHADPADPDPDLDPKPCILGCDVHTRTARNVTYFVFEAVMYKQGGHEIVTYFVFEAEMYRGSMRTSTAEAKPMQRAPESI